MSRALLAGSRPMLAWLRAHPSWRALPLALRSRIAWQAQWGSLNARLAAASAPAAVPLRDPLLIAGPWRSGTTVMHELLTAATGWPTPRTWQCMNACAFQLGRPASGNAVLARPMDGLAIRADSPQEDEFALLTLGVPSAYRAFWMPQRLSELEHTLDPAWWLANPQWLATWEAFLQGVLRAEAGDRGDRRLILKSPSHTYRLRAIRARHPSVQVVWMARRATDVFLSNRKMWRSMFAAHALPNARIDDAALDAFLARAVDGAADALSECVQTMPGTRLAIVSHAELLDEPERVTRRLVAWIGHGATVHDADLAEALAVVARGRVEVHPASDLPEESARACARLEAAQAAALPVFGPAAWLSPRAS